MAGRRRPDTGPADDEEELRTAPGPDRAAPAVPAEEDYETARLSRGSWKGDLQAFVGEKDLAGEHLGGRGQ
jgi:hypothetical protein